MDLQAAQYYFELWFVNPIRSLDGNGGWVAMTVAMALYERLIKARLKQEGLDENTENVGRKVSEDLSLNDIDRRIFWDTFRNGLLHQAMPKAGSTGILFMDHFSGVPVFKMFDGMRVICVNPFKFADRVFEAFLEHPELILMTNIYPFAWIADIDVSKFENE